MRQRWHVGRSSYFSRRRHFSGGGRRSRSGGARGRYPPHRGHRFRILLVIAAVVGLLVLINEQLKPFLESSVAQQAGLVSVQTVNQAVGQVLADNPLPQDYLTVNRDANGEIQSIDTDAQSISALKTKLNLQIQQALDNMKNCSVAIPIGTLLGSNLLRGVGPSVHLRFSVASNVFCNLVSTFDSAGVNQTRHSLSLVVSTEIYAMIPGLTAKTTTETTFPVAESVIIGKVPNLYWSGNGSAANSLNGTNSASEKS